MPTYQIQTIASAPEKSKWALEQLQQAFGFLPNLASISNSPKLVTALVGVFQQVHSSSLTEQEHRSLRSRKNCLLTKTGNGSLDQHAGADKPDCPMTQVLHCKGGLEQS